MKVLLKDDVHNLGYAGEVINVADGYGRNYLIPKGLAVKASASVLKEAENWRERAAVRVTEIRKEHEVLSGQINETRLLFYARAGETGKLYGSVTTADIADKLNEELGTDIDRRLITSAPLRQLGEHKVTIKLSRDFHPQVTVNVHPLEVKEEIETVEFDAEEIEMAEDIESAEVGDDAQAETSPDHVLIEEESMDEETAVQESESIDEDLESSNELETPHDDDEIESS